MLSKYFSKFLSIFAEKSFLNKIAVFVSFSTSQCTTTSPAVKVILASFNLLYVLSNGNFQSVLLFHHARQKIRKMTGHSTFLDKPTKTHGETR